MTWNIDQNQEISYLEVSDQSFTIFDKNGEIYLIEEDRVHITREKVCLTCFNIGDLSKQNINA